MVAGHWFGFLKGDAFQLVHVFFFTEFLNDYRAENRHCGAKIQPWPDSRVKTRSESLKNSWKFSLFASVCVRHPAPVDVILFSVLLVLLPALTSADRFIGDREPNQLKKLEIETHRGPSLSRCFVIYGPNKPKFICVLYSMLRHADLVKLDQNLFIFIHQIV